MVGRILAGSNRKRYAGRTTPYVLLACLMAACGGLMFGYAIGISGGVTSMDDFLQKYFPEVYTARLQSKSNYCQYNNQGLQAFTSSLYLAGMAASVAASFSSRKWGRTRSIFIGGSTYLVGAILSSAAQNIEMLILGRMSLGIGIGFACQAVPLYLSEIAPVHWRGALNIMFQLIITSSILCANLVNYGMGKATPWGWRVSLGLATIPGAIVTLGSVFLPETPHNLLERGWNELARTALETIRGTPNVTEEFEDMVKSDEDPQQTVHPFRNLFRKKYIPQLTVGVLIPFFNQMTGINAIMFYVPILFKIIGFGNDAALYSAVIVGAVNVLSTLVAVAVVDKWGRKPLFYQSGVQMFISLVSVGVILEYKLDPHGQLPRGFGIAVVVLVCLFVSSFACSWGPLLWLISSEIFPLEIRACGVSVAVAVNFFWTFAVGQSWLTLLCVMRYGIFHFFGAWVTLMTLFVALLCPETKNVPMPEVILLFQNHWVWKRVYRAPRPTVLDEGGLRTESYKVGAERLLRSQRGIREPGVEIAEV